MSNQNPSSLGLFILQALSLSFLAVMGITPYGANAQIPSLPAEAKKAAVETTVPAKAQRDEPFCIEGTCGMLSNMSGRIAGKTLYVNGKLSEGLDKALEVRTKDASFQCVEGDQVFTPPVGLHVNFHGVRGTLTLQQKVHSKYGSFYIFDMPAEMTNFFVKQGWVAYDKAKLFATTAPAPRKDISNPCGATLKIDGVRL